MVVGYTASDLLSEYWDGTIPVEPEQIARKIGIRVVPEFQIESGVSGIISMEDGKPVIRYDMTDAPVRQRFTIAHEIGHYVGGHLKSLNACFRDTRKSFSTGQTDWREAEANNFAAELLVPAKWLKYVIAEKKIHDVTRLANLFNVSEAAMGYRLKNLGIN